MDYTLKVENLFKNQLSEWQLAQDNYKALTTVLIRKIAFDGFDVEIQFNPERVRSTMACTDNRKLEKQNSCFLCSQNRPAEQKGIPFDDNLTILCNPYPVFPQHLTIASNIHQPQAIAGNLPSMLNLAKSLPDFVVFYNGPKCGASAPMHLHFQAGPKSKFPLYNDFHFLKEQFGTSLSLSKTIIKDNLRTFFVLESADFQRLSDDFYNQFGGVGEEPDLNILVWFEKENWTICVFERKQHRPPHFYAEGDKQIMVSPATVEMAGLVVTPRLIDFEKISKDDLIEIYKACLKS